MGGLHPHGQVWGGQGELPVPRRHEAKAETTLPPGDRERTLYICCELSVLVAMPNSMGYTREVTHRQIITILIVMLTPALYNRWDNVATWLSGHKQ